MNPATTVAGVEALLGYKFRNPSLLTEALTHSSKPNHANYDRLEFVGDAALGLAFSYYLYRANPDLDSGGLTELRAVNVSNERLARVAVRHRLYRLLRRNCPQLDEEVRKFALVVERESEEELVGLHYGGNTMKAPKVLADIVESIAAAVYFDCNFNLERLWMAFNSILEPIMTPADKHPVTALNEYCQKKGKKFDLKTWKEGNLNIANVVVDGERLGIGSSEYLNIAKLNAVRDALKKLGGSGQDGVVMGGGPNGGGEVIKSQMQKLHEMCEKKHWPKPVYRIEEEQGPDHDKKFASSVRLVISNKEYITIGDLSSGVRNSEHSAAAMMLNEIIKHEELMHTSNHNPGECTDEDEEEDASLQSGSSYKIVKYFLFFCFFFFVVSSLLESS